GCLTGGRFGWEVHAALRRVRGGQRVGRVHLQPGGGAAAVHPLRDPVERQVREPVGTERHVAVPGERRRLYAQVARRLEIREHDEVVLLELRLVDASGVEVGDAFDREGGRDAGTIRDLKVSDEGSCDRAELAGRVEQVLEVAESVPLTRVVVDCTAGGGGGDADAVLQVVRGHEV